jgi:DNA-binding NtrC family response regulator
LRGLEIVLPPLRQRDDDVLLLTQHFVNVLAGKSGEVAKSFSLEALAAVRRYAWPGNVRELWRVIESCLVMCRGPEVGVEHLPAFVAEGEAAARHYVLHLQNAKTVRLTELVEQFEDDVIQWALAQANGQQARAADLLSVPRTTLQSKLGRRRDK